MLALGPLYYYKLDAASGSQLDSSGHSYTLTTTGGSGYVFQVAGLIPTSSDTACNVGGAGGNSTNSGAVPFTGNAMTIIAWINTLTSSSIAHITMANVGASSAQQLLQFRLSAGVLQGILIDNTGGHVAHTAAGSGSLSDGKNHMVAMTWDGTTITLYVDGVVNGAPLVGAFTMNAMSCQLGIGSSVGLVSGNNIGGTIDEAAGWLSTLTAAQISHLYSLATTT